MATYLSELKLLHAIVVLFCGQSSKTFKSSRAVN